MIEDAVETGNSGGACPDLGAFLRFGHRWMSSLGHQGIKLGDVFPGQEFRVDGEKDVRVVVASFVRDDREHAHPRLDA